ncbi:MAG TPA: tRNA (adenosine(37)-N6)-dimethylallyltransferase MiaA [Terriglobia bacterium]|nr:tRNA (adenosine(37)-N6)-dimethylallyltransferase MiaA [Terriglobia bacterium]
MVDPLGGKGPAARTAGAPLLAILGPTASGKSALAIELALRLGGEIVNYDSVQLYRGFDMGAGKLPAEDRRGVPHHLLDVLDPEQVFTAGDYRRAASQAIDSIRQRMHVPILVGGTGFYLRALLVGLFEGPARSESLRARLDALAERRASLRARAGGGRHPDSEAARAAVLHRLLARLDSATAARIHPHDRQKTLRALEVCLLTRQPMSRMLEHGREGLAGFDVIKVGLHPDRAHLHERINRRVEKMFAAGLVDETRAARERSGGSGVKPLEALGYRQAWSFLEGAIGLEEAVRQTQAATRQYAKRQMTWFRREPGVEWFAGFGDDPGVQQQVLDRLSSRRDFNHAHA